LVTVEARGMTRPIAHAHPVWRQMLNSLERRGNGVTVTLIGCQDCARASV
jgi:hypothetical protein